MPLLHAIVLGIVQGLTEFLPVSSSGHLILVPHVFGWPDQGQTFDAVMHIGTLAALVAYFRIELVDLARGTLSRRVGLILLAATTAFWGVVMWVADRRAAAKAASARDPLEHVGWSRALVVGGAQAVALIPGTSRSGITITAGLFAGLDRATAARFSFLLGIPITGAAGSYKLLQLMKTGVPAGQAGPLAVAVLAAFLSGWLAVWFLVGYLRRRSLTPFVIYRLALAAAILLAVR